MISYKQSVIVLACNIMQIAQYTLPNMKSAGIVLAPSLAPLWHLVRHPYGTPSGTPVEPGLSPGWHPLVTFNCGCLIWCLIWCHLRVPLGHHIFWVPNGALWGVVFWTRVWHLKRCHMAPFIATVLVVRASDLRLNGREFDPRPPHALSVGWYWDG